MVAVTLQNMLTSSDIDCCFNVHYYTLNSLGDATVTIYFSHDTLY